MKCEIKKLHIIATSKYDIPFLSNYLNAEEILKNQVKDEYVKELLSKPNNNIDFSEEDSDICGICQISFNHHCNHCHIKLKKLCPLSNGVCNHFFHLHCIERWLEQGTSGSKCPMCRQNYFANNSNNESIEENDNDEEILD
ncbi:hypothetical protein HANVADRAFT_37341 [Hanseniaspora valbyensis NRRL Y-1626]|uniref:Anaphase-promoting complex subunit 11 n=1 Tax=Hanseniaspora valbyensis NRRL Y-1626 TaxID=766949 RepID=A0A1B7TI19_9ASCO|nr:hypothetical protein HANVADRAFT_37341 [Hanseniaspora valbyensis NRRL Y-1626]